MDVVQSALGRAALLAAGSRIWGGVSAGSGRTTEEATATARAATRRGRGRGARFRMSQEGGALRCAAGPDGREGGLGKAPGFSARTREGCGRKGLGAKTGHTQREMSRGRAQMSRAQGRACLQMGLLLHLLKPEVLRATRGPHVCAVKPALYFLI